MWQNEIKQKKNIEKIFNHFYKTMKNSIAFISLTNCFGGAENLIYSLYKFLQPNSTLLFLTNRCEYKDQISGRIKYYTKTKYLVLGVINFCFKINELNRYNYIFTSHQYLNSIIGLFKKTGLITKPNLIFRESTPIFLRNKGLKLHTYRTAYYLGYGPQSLIITQSHLMKSQLLENVSITKKCKVITIPNPLDIEDIILKSIEYRTYRRSFIVSAGRLIPEKGFDILIKAYSEIKKHINYQKLLIIGEGPEKNSLELLIKDLGLTEHVTLMGHMTNPMPYFKSADLCVVSSRIEGFPNVLLQMMALNGNVVSTLCAGGIDELNGVNTCAPNDPVSLGITIRNALKHEYNNSEIYSNDLKKRSINKYWAIIQNKLDD